MTGAVGPDSGLFLGDVRHYAMRCTVTNKNYMGFTLKKSPSLSECNTTPRQSILIGQIYPLVNIQKAIEHGPVEIVDFPIEHGDFP